MTMLRVILTIYLSCWKRSFEFRGRARRRELVAFWVGNITLILASFFTIKSFGAIASRDLTLMHAAGFLTIVLIPTLGPFFVIWSLLFLGTHLQNSLAVVSLLVAFIFLIPAQALLVRRMHDLNTRGGWLLYGLVPYIGPIISGVLFLILLFTEGDKSTNRFGLAPGARDPSRCAQCSYDLTGNVTGICPECGTKVGAAPVTPC